MYPVVLLLLSRDYRPETDEYNYFDFTPEERSTIMRHFPSFLRFPEHLRMTGRLLHHLRLSLPELSLLCAVEIVRREDVPHHVGIIVLSEWFFFDTTVSASAFVSPPPGLIVRNMVRLQLMPKSRFKSMNNNDDAGQFDVPRLIRTDFFCLHAPQSGDLVCGYPSSHHYQVLDEPTRSSTKELYILAYHSLRFCMTNNLDITCDSSEQHRWAQLVAMSKMIQAMSREHHMILTNLKIVSPLQTLIGKRGGIHLLVLAVPAAMAAVAAVAAEASSLSQTAQQQQQQQQQQQHQQQHFSATPSAVYHHHQSTTQLEPLSPTPALLSRSDMLTGIAYPSSQRHASAGPYFTSPASSFFFPAQTHPPPS
ncbi:unnamed protein product [Echinostoma caproni]|uniref:NR LBD domain-containing protein n=1 Tax=Echinostoma caproni TaxID=27848 RepID=A0A183AGX1_9TREM|nr:unnamed protein product [Echinostoma caproni]